MNKTPIARLVNGQRLAELSGKPFKLLSKCLHRDITQIYRIFNGTTGLSIEVAIRLAQVMGPINVDMDGFIVEIRPIKPYKSTYTDELTPAEAGWVCAQENAEAEAHMNELLRALRSDDMEVMAHIFEQLICDPRHANQMLEVAIARVLGERFHSVRDVAYENHSRKIEARYSQVA